MTYTEAVGLAIMIERWWHQRGFASVVVTPEVSAPFRFNDDQHSYRIVSNLRNGLPPGASAADYVAAARRHRLAEQGLSA